MIRVKLSKMILGIGFAYKGRPLSKQESAVLKSAERVLHLEAPQVEKVRRAIEKTQLRSTTCTLYELDALDSTFHDAREMLSVVKPCSRDDNFDKEKGRKVSLLAALDQTQIPKADRLRVWDAYHSRREVKSNG